MPLSFLKQGVKLIFLKKKTVTKCDVNLPCWFGWKGNVLKEEVFCLMQSNYRYETPRRQNYIISVCPWYSGVHK